MTTAALSARVNLEQSRKQAKDLVKAVKAADPAAFERIRWNHPRLHGLSAADIRKHKFTLADAQLVIARSHYFESWPKLLRHIETLSAHDPRITRFERAADAIIHGDIETLVALLHAHPALVRQRSTRAHRAPLLHYVAANGVEDYRQLTPTNAVDVARALLDAGAEVDAASKAYGGGSTALGLVATSAHPRRAGVQIPLIDLLLAHGAAIDGRVPGNGTVMAALENGCPEAAIALVERGARVDTVIAAAGVGRLDLVNLLIDGSTRDQRERGLVMAARYGHTPVVVELLDKGVDVGASDGMTALHEAAGRGHLELARLLIARGAPLEKENAYGGTALTSTLWFAYHADPEQFAAHDFPAAIELLITAGARMDVYPELEAHIDEVYRRAGKQRVRS